MSPTVQEIIQDLILLISTTAAVVAWIAKIKWSKEYTIATESRINAIKEKCDFYKEIISTSLIEFQKKEMEYLEGAIQKLNIKLHEKENELNLFNENVAEQNKKLQIVNDTLFERQQKIEEQSELLRAHAESLKQKNELLIEKQKLIDIRHEKLYLENTELKETIKSLMK